MNVLPVCLCHANPLRIRPSHLALTCCRYMQCTWPGYPFHAGLYWIGSRSSQGVRSACRKQLEYGFGVFVYTTCLPQQIERISSWNLVFEKLFKAEIWPAIASYWSEPGMTSLEAGQAMFLLTGTRTIVLAGALTIYSSGGGAMCGFWMIFFLQRPRLFVLLGPWGVIDLSDQYSWRNVRVLR